MSNWVEEKAKELRAINKVLRERDDLSEAVKSALKEVCASFNRDFARQARYEANIHEGTGNQMTITCTSPADGQRRFQDTDHEAVIVFNEESREIKARIDNGSWQKFTYEADERTAYISDGKQRLTPDKLSQQLLQLVLFPYGWLEPKEPPTA